MFPGLGISLVIAGLVFILLVWLVLRVSPRMQAPAPQADNRSLSYPETSKSNDSVILLQPGGRVEHMTDSARMLFDLREDEPYDLERLARRVRPSDDFLDLCASPGQKRVSLSGKVVEIASFEVPGVYPMMLLSLREKDLAPALEQGNEASDEILQVVTEFSQSIAASLDLETTMQSIMDNVSRLVPSDLLELKLWNAPDQALIPYRFTTKRDRAMW